MSKKLLSGIFYGIFFLIFFTMVGIMVKGFIDQNNDEKAQIAGYESMISEGSKVELTDEILDKDFDKYVQDSEKGKKTFITLLVCFGSVVVWFIVLFIFNLILRGMEEGANSSMFIILLASFLTVMLMIGSFAFISLRVIVPNLTKSNPGNEKYFFRTVNIKDAERVEEREEVRTSDGTEHRTNVYYHYIDEDGNVLSVNKVLYSRFVGEGVYYMGQTAAGRIFSVYPDKYFILSE